MTNFFDLFESAALDWWEEASQTRELSPEFAVAVLREHDNLGSAFSSGSDIDYSLAARRFAYSCFYAPKHAYLWQSYIRLQWSRVPEVVRLTSIGTGPGSELIGIAEAQRLRGSKGMVAHCLERVEEWQTLAEFVFARYQETTGFSIQPIWVSTLSNCVPGQQVVGSFVLSEFARQGYLPQFREGLIRHLRPCSGTFVDGVQVNVGGNCSLLSAHVNYNSYTHYRSSPCSCFRQINGDRNAAPRFCGHDLPDDPNVIVFRHRFQ